MQLYSLNGKMRTALGLLMLAPVMTGCMNWPYDRGMTSSVVGQPTPLDGYQYSLAEDMPLSRAFVSLSQIAGQPIAVRETRFANGVEQFVILQSEATADGENRVEIRAVGGTSDVRVIEQHTEVRSTDLVSIQKELRDFVWGTQMKIVQTVESNAYGTFGYALGQRSSGYNCMYGWQTVKGERKQKNLFGIFAGSSTKLSVRVRLCRSDLTQRQLVDVMRTMRVTMAADALDVQPKLQWRNESYGVSSTGGPDGTVPGYITEGLAPLDGVTPSVVPLASAPVVQRTIVRTTTRTAPVTRAPTRTTTRRVVETVRDDRALSELNPDRNKTTIFVDPREYEAVPLPDDISNAPQIRQGTVQQNGSRFAVPGNTAPGIRVIPLSQNQTSGVQSEASREQRKNAVSQLNGQNVNNSGLWEGSSENGLGQDSRNKFLAPEREGYRGLDLEEIQRQSRVEGSNAKHNLWLNDVARNDNTGMPLQRPCELLKDANCAQTNAANRAPSILRSQ